jgi:ABC-2 type transport system permease protein
MTASTPTIGVSTNGDSNRISAGLGNLLRKDIRDWLRTRRAVATSLAMTTVVTLATLAAWIAVSTGRHLPAAALDPTANFLGAGWFGTIPLIVVFATMGSITGERDRGTLAWSLSHPAARPAFVISKFISAAAALVVLAATIPVGAATAVASLAYGGAPDLGQVVQVAVALVPQIVFFVALTTALGVFLKSQGPVAALAIVLTFAPRFLHIVAPDLNQYLPTSIGTWTITVLQGGSASSATPVAWAVAVVGLLVLAAVRLERAEL